MLLDGLAASIGAALVATSATPSVTISQPQATLVGEAGSTVESFLSIPFAQPPVGPLRLKPPQPIQSELGTIQCTDSAPACPQFFSDTDGDLPASVLGWFTDMPLFQKALNENEDCLYINVYRPAGTTAADSLPVLFWIFGGGFELGWASMYDGSGWVESSMDLNQPIIFVTVAYRVAGFGFMPGREILADGSANLGLLDQRLGLQWVADNIAAFGGDPDKVTIWGESAGAISVFDHLLAYDGNNTYHGKALFRAAIMNSGTAVPADPVDGVKGQAVYDTVVRRAGCDTASDSLECLRGLDYDSFLEAANSVPALLAYSGAALSYLPRPDGTFLTESPDVLANQGRIAKVPVIIGDQEDEGTLFALFQHNITTEDELISYLQDPFFFGANRTLVSNLVSLYSDISEYGSPFRTTNFINNWYPQFKRLAAILGDLTFTLTRRGTLDVLKGMAVRSWSYLSSYDHGLPILGTTHASDLLQLFFNPLPNYPTAAFRAYYISFVNHLDPNEGTNGSYPVWPEWSVDEELLNMNSDDSKLIKDDFRQDVLDFILVNEKDFYIKR